MQFDPSTSKDPSPTVTTVSDSGTTTTTSQDKTKNIVTTASSVTVSPAVALTTPVVSTPNVTIETETKKSSNDTKSSGLPEANNEKSEDSSSAGTTVQVEEKDKETFVDDKDAPTDDSSNINQIKEAPVAAETKPPLSPTGSLHSDSGESGTGVRAFFFLQYFGWVGDNLVPRVLRLFDQRLVARRDSGVLEFYYRRISAVKQWKPLRSSCRGTNQKI